MADSQQPVLPDQGQDQVSNQEPQGQPAAPEAYFEYVRPDGKKDSYATREDLTREWRLRGLREDDYRRKTQTAADERRAFEQERKQFQEDMRAFQQNKQRYDEWDSRIRQLDPRQYSQLQQALQGPVDPSHVLTQSREYADENISALRQELEELKEANSRRDAESQLNAALDQFGQAHSDFDRDAALEYMDSLADASPQVLIETVYHAMRGRDPSRVEEKVAENFKKKAAAGAMPPAPSGNNGDRVFTSIRAARDAALADAGVSDADYE